MGTRSERGWGVGVGGTKATLASSFSCYFKRPIDKKEKSPQIMCEGKVLGKARRSRGCISFRGLCAPAPACRHPDILQILSPSSRNQTEAKLLHKHLIRTRMSLLGTFKS